MLQLPDQKKGPTRKIKFRKSGITAEADLTIQNLPKLPFSRIALNK